MGGLLRATLCGLALATLTTCGSSDDPCAGLSCSGGECCTAFIAGTDMSSIDWGLGPEFATFMQAAGDSIAAHSASRDLARACQRLAEDLGAEAGQVESDLDEPAMIWCDAAAARIRAVFGPKDSLPFDVIEQATPCRVSLELQATCEAACAQNLDETCRAALRDPKVRCAPDSVVSTCDGACDGACAGSALVAVPCTSSCVGECDGACDGACRGQCDGVVGAGPCAGHCDGVCEGVCTGSCRGECKPADGEPAHCPGRCTGTCLGNPNSVECSAASHQAPSACGGLSADCVTLCALVAESAATCTAGAVQVVARPAGTVDEQLRSVLEADLAEVFRAEARCSLMLEDLEAATDFAVNWDPSTASAAAVVCLLGASIQLSDGVWTCSQSAYTVRYALGLSGEAP